MFHTTGTAGTVAAAATAGRLLGLSAAQMLDAFGSAGTQASGLWEFLRDAADSKQLHTAMAAANGLMAAQLAADGFKGATHILEGAQGMAAGMSSDADPARLVDRLGSRWATAETSFKYHAACRHTHPAADALLAVVQEHRLAPRDIAKVVAHVHQGAIDVLGAVVTPRTVHQAKFNMGTVLGLVAHHGYAGVTEFEQGFDADAIAAFRDNVEDGLRRRSRCRLSRALDRQGDGRPRPTAACSTGRVDEPKGDPGNTLSRDEIATKLHRLAAFSGAATEGEAARLLGNAWQIAGQTQVGSVFEAESNATVAA